MAQAQFQSFEDVCEKAESPARLKALRAELQRLGVDGFLIPRADEFQGEYVPPSAERLSWLTGFTGSAGLAVVLKDRAALFVDGRYTLQARDQVDTDLVEIVFIKDQTPEDFLEATLGKGDRLAYDPWLHTAEGTKRLEGAAHKAGASLEALDENPVDRIWQNRPAAPSEPASIHPEVFAGEASEAKRERLAKAIQEAGADGFVLAQPDNLAWLLNIRGRDVPHTPFFLAFALADAKGKVTLFADEARLPDDVLKHLGKDVALAPPADFLAKLERLTKADKRIALDHGATPAAVARAIVDAGGSAVRLKDPITAMKAVKNAAELAGTRAAHIRDGLALTRFLAWLARETPGGTIDEISAAKALEGFRRETNALEDLSFDTISGAGPNGAIVHYRVTEPTARTLESGMLYLVDSGGQYRDGTTDVTRTVAIGDPVEEMRDRFTRVLKGHIALAVARFPKGTSGAQLDVLARMALWRAGLDFDHGTGHGVGSFLSVHEGPQGISPRATTPLEPGMILSNEPGYYREGAYGIRIENLVVVTDGSVPQGGERAMLGFETLTMAPIDRALIDRDLLTSEERAWVDTYHARVAALHLPELKGEDAEWLRAATAPL